MEGDESRTRPGHGFCSELNHLWYSDATDAFLLVLTYDWCVDCGAQNPVTNTEFIPYLGRRRVENVIDTL